MAPRAALRRDDVARVTAALAAYTRTQDEEDLAVCSTRAADLELSTQEVGGALSAETQHWLEEVEFPEEGDVSLDRLNTRLRWRADDLDAETLDQLIPLCAFMATRACGQLEPESALPIAEFVLGTQGVADTVGVSLVPWVLQLD